jgi:NAD(P)-dependent dehydrogenase (short-subunit alcohol dehydrogenase family)
MEPLDVLQERLTGKLALVTGGGRGIGLAIALRLARDGAKVIVTGRTREDLERTAEAVHGHALVCDLSDRASTDAMVESAKAIGRVDILINNAGIAESAPLAKTDDAMWDRIVELNATAPFRLTRAFVPAMIDAGWGRVVTIASNAGLTGYGYTSAYCAAKHATVGMTRALAVDLGRSGVTINAVCPGWVATRMADEAIARIAARTGRDVGAARAALESMSPQHRLVEPEEVAASVSLLCSESGRGIHGQTIVIDGGAVMK